jgi:hypothetical protein
VVDLARSGTGGEHRFVTDLPEGLRDMIRAGMP